MTRRAPYNLVMEKHWIRVCKVNDIRPFSGVSALVLGRQVAIFRMRADVYAISDYDPFSASYVLSRGRVRQHAGIARVSSPIYNQSFSLVTGECIDDPSVKLPIYPVQVVDGIVHIALQ